MRSVAQRYGLPFLSTGAVLIVVALLDRMLPFPPLVLFAVPVAFASRYGGRGPAVVCTLACVVAIDFAFVPPIGQINVAQPEVWMYAATFAATAMVLDANTEALRAARRLAEQHAEALVRVNARLQDEMEETRVLSENLQEQNLHLEDARQVAESATRAREEVLAVVAHDLRNPLNLVTMSTQLILDIDPSDEQRRELLSVMQRAAQRMHRLIGDLLEIVRIEAGQLRLELKPVEVNALLSQTIEVFEQDAARRGIALGAEQPQRDGCVVADSDRILQVLGNLVGNAMKFVEAGGRIRLRCGRRNGEVVFSVSDSGRGIPPDQLEHLFERFWQARRSDTRGVGLGLSIARGIVEAHGGRIWARSRVGSGTTFYFTLPATQQRADGPTHGAGAPGRREGLRARSMRVWS